MIGVAEVRIDSEEVAPEVTPAEILLGEFPEGIAAFHDHGA